MNMDAMQFNGVQISGQEVLNTGRDNKGLVKGGQSEIPFMQIIENMVAGMMNSEEQEDEEKSLIVGENLILGMAQDEQSDKDDGVESLENMVKGNLAFGLGQVPNQIQAQIRQISTDEIKLINGEASLETESTKSLGQADLANANIGTNVNLGQGEALQNQDVSGKTAFLVPKESKLRNSFLMGSANKVEEVVAKPEIISSVVQNAEPVETDEMLKTDHQFLKAVDIVKRNIKEQSKNPDQQAISIAETVTLKTQELSKNAPAQVLDFEMENAKLAENMKTQINTHLAKGESEFIMKLKPEELGEITIKMHKSGEKVTIDIVASNQKAAQLLNSEIAALRETLKPMQAEVRPIILVENSEGFKQMQDFNMSGQNFADQQDRWNNRENQSSYYGDEIIEEDTKPLDEIIDSNQKLRMYI